jgi:hypothetical protein
VNDGENPWVKDGENPQFDAISARGRTKKLGNFSK